MKKISKGIVFSNDIFRILKGKNALRFSYEELGMKMPSEREIEFLRKDFAKDVNRIFKNDVEIISEQEMEDFLYDSLEDSWEYPHCIAR